MRIRNLFLILVCLALLGVSCSEELKPTPYTYTRHFTGANSKTWKVKLFEETLNGKVVDRFMPSCLTDDQFIFSANSDHAYQTTSGSKKCFEEEAASTVSSWTFVNATATLTIPFGLFGDGPIPFFVIEAGDEDFVAELFFDQASTESYRIHFELVDEE